MTSIEAENKAYIQLRSAELYTKLYEEESQYPFLRVTKDEYGVKAVYEQTECYISSIYNIENELEGYFSEAPSNTEVIVYLGWLSPDVIEYAKKKFKRLRRLVFIEPAIQLLQTNFKLNRLIDILKLSGKLALTILPNFNPLGSAAQMNEIVGMANRVFMVTTVAYKTLFSEYCAQVVGRISENMRHHLINLTTNNLYYIDWAKAQMKNYEVSSYSVESLIPLFLGRPVILVSAGPSLQKNVELLREAQNKAIIIAVGSSVYILNKLKMSRHFNAGMDTKQPDFQSPDFPDMPLLYDTRLNSATLERYTGPRINFISASDFMGRHLCIDKTNAKYVPDSGMSIAVSIASLVCKLGASKLIFIGQDMCFYEDKVHYLDDKKHAHHEKMMHLTDINGNKVIASPNYWSIKRYLDAVIEKHPEVECINATEGGLGLDGAKNIPLRDVLETLPEFTESIETTIRKLLDATPSVSMFSFWADKEVPEDLKKVIKSCEKGVEQLKKIESLRKNRAAKKKIEKQIAGAWKQFEKIQENDFFNNVIKRNLISIFQSLDMLYDADTHSPDWDIATNAQIKKAIGGFIPILQACTVMDRAYYKWCINNGVQIQKNTESSNGSA